MTILDVSTRSVDQDLVSRLEDKAITIRKQIVLSSHLIGVVHLGGPLSATDVAVALYYEFLGFDPENLNDPDRNKFILSKGHNGVLLYNILADKGLYDWDELFGGYNKPDHPFGMHPNRKHIRGIEASTGSLGHGMSIATGLALANRVDNKKSRIFVMTGDGEMEEGSNWEAAMYAGSHQLSNLVLIIDFNKATGMFRLGENIVVDYVKAFDAFGWDVIEIDGNDMEQVVTAFQSLPPVDFTTKSNPTVIISHTVKGAGVDFMSGSPKWHLGSIDDKNLDVAIASIESTRKARN
jgi:transketolase